MAANQGKRLLVTIRQAPYSSSLARASLEVALAAAAFEQDVAVLFLGDGVLQLLPEQDTGELGLKNIGRLLGSLPLYDIETVYVEAAAARRYHIDLQQSPVPTRALSRQEMQALMADRDHLLGF